MYLNSISGPREFETDDRSPVRYERYGKDAYDDEEGKKSNIFIYSVKTVNKQIVSDV